MHLAFDLPSHNADAHQHFWPLSDYRFHSPLSYWSSAHHSDYVRMLEIGIALVCAAILWQRFDALWIKGLMAAFIVSYLARPFLASLWLR